MRMEGYGTGTGLYEELPPRRLGEHQPPWPGGEERMREDGRNADREESQNTEECTREAIVGNCSLICIPLQPESTFRISHRPHSIHSSESIPSPELHDLNEALCACSLPRAQRMIQIQ